MFAQMTATNATPTFGYCDEVMMDAVMAARLEMKAAALDLGLKKFTLMPLLMKATSLALTGSPRLGGAG